MAEPLGVRFVLEGVSELSFVRILNTLMHDATFARPIQIQVQSPRSLQSGGLEPGVLTVGFWPESRSRGLLAVQRLKTILLDHGVQIDTIRMLDEEPGEGN